MLISSLEVDWIEEQAAPQIYLTYFMHDTIPRLRSQKKKISFKKSSYQISIQKTVNFIVWWKKISNLCSAYWQNEDKLLQRKPLKQRGASAMYKNLKKP